MRVVKNFFVVEAQPAALEVAVAEPTDEIIEFDEATAARFLVGPGDFFFVPPLNIYRLENLSKTIPAKVVWTVIQVLCFVEPADLALLFLLSLLRSVSLIACADLVCVLLIDPVR